LSDYGESYVKTLTIFIFVVVSFAILFMFVGIQRKSYNRTSKHFSVSRVNNDEVKYVPAFQLPSIKNLCVDFSRSLAYSFSVATIFLKDRQYTYKTECGYYLFILESFLGAVILPLLLLAVRRNFKRSIKEKFYG